MFDMMMRLALGTLGVGAAFGLADPWPAAAAERARAPATRAAAPEARAYAGEIRKIIDARKASTGYEGAGRTVARFTIRRTGELVQVALDDGPAEPAVGRAAIAMIQNASRDFPPFPAGMRQEEQSYSLPISFQAK